MNAWARRVGVALVLAMMGLGCSTSGESTTGEDADAAPELLLDVGSEVPGDLGAESALEILAEVQAEIPIPSEPFFESGLIVQEDAIPCMEWETGTVLEHCNHHGSSVDVTADGTVIATWYHGKGEKSKDSRLLWAVKPAGADWQPWEVLYDDPGLAEGNPVIWVAEADEWLVFFVTIEGESWSDGVIRLIRSDDRGEHWTEPVTLRAAWNGMTRNKPIRLPGGELLLPLYDESWYAPSSMRSKDDFVSDWQEFWLEGTALIEHIHMIQPTVIPRDDGSVFALLRNTNEAVPQQAWEMESLDGGQTWGEARASVVPNHGASLEMTLMNDGVVALTFNNSTSGRFPLSVALSDDEGRTWSAVADLFAECPGAGCSYAYPSIAQDPTDGSLWVTYTHNRRTIGWVHTNAPWIRAQGGVFAD